MKIISIDSNCNWLGPTKPIISPFTIEHLELHEGDIVIGYQDEQEWEGIVRFDATCPEEMQWYFDMNLDKEYPVSMERMKGREEGSRTSMPYGEIRGEIYVAMAMLNDGMDVEQVKKYTRLSQTRLNNLKTNIDKQKTLKRVKKIIDEWDPIHLFPMLPTMNTIQKLKLSQTQLI